MLDFELDMRTVWRVFFHELLQRLRRRIEIDHGWNAEGQLERSVQVRTQSL